MHRDKIQLICLNIGQDMCLVHRLFRVGIQHNLVRASPDTPSRKISMSKSESRKVTSQVHFRCTEEVKSQLESKAKQAGMSLGKYLQTAGLGRKIQATPQYDNLAQLIKITALQKHLFKEGQGEMSKQYSEIMQAIKNAAEALRKEIEGE